MAVMVTCGFCASHRLMIQIHASIYSPYQDVYLTNPTNYEQFEMAYEMPAGEPYALIGTNTDVASGSTASVSWASLAPLAEHEWYVTVSDAEFTTTSPSWTFTTRAALQYTLTTTPGTGGSITRDPDQATYDAGTVVTLTAVPNSGYSFTSWGGDLGGSTSPTTITMDGNKSVTATFTLIPPTCYALTLGHTGEGSDPGCQPGQLDRLGSMDQYVCGGDDRPQRCRPCLAAGRSTAGPGQATTRAPPSTNSLTMPAGAPDSAGVNYVRVDSTGWTAYNDVHLLIIHRHKCDHFYLVTDLLDPSGILVDQAQASNQCDG